MIPAAQLASLTPAQRAAVILADAKAPLTNRLWQAALGSTDARTPDAPFVAADTGLDVSSLLALYDARHPPAMRPRDDAVDVPCRIDDLQAGRLGPNAMHRNALASAAQRTGIPETALAAIVNAEAAKDRSGRWNCYSRNTRSSAAGLGQFLSGTWESMAEKRGTWLNGVAHEKGWLGERGHIRPAARAAMLQLRYDPAAAIHTTADYARGNLAILARAGVNVGGDAPAIARTAYLGHHLGAGDAIKFLKGGLTDGRARNLLVAQLGSNRAERAISANGTASAAHRAWLTRYVARTVQPQRFA